MPADIWIKISMQHIIIKTISIKIKIIFKAENFCLFVFVGKQIGGDGDDPDDSDDDAAVSTLPFFGCSPIHRMKERKLKEKDDDDDKACACIIEDDDADAFVVAAAALLTFFLLNEK